MSKRRANFFESGEIATIIAIGSMVFILITTVASSLISRRPQTTSTLAAATCCTMRDCSSYCTGGTSGKQWCLSGSTYYNSSCTAISVYSYCGCGGGGGGSPTKASTQKPNPTSPGGGGGSSCPAQNWNSRSSCEATCGAGNCDTCGSSSPPYWKCKSAGGGNPTATPAGGGGSCNCPGKDGGPKYDWLSFNKCICTNCRCRGTGNSMYCSTNSGSGDYYYVDSQRCCDAGKFSSACNNAASTAPTKLPDKCSSAGGKCTDSCSGTQLSGDAQSYCQINEKKSYCCKPNPNIPTSTPKPGGTINTPTPRPGPGGTDNPQQVKCTQGTCYYDSGLWTTQCPAGSKVTGQECYGDFGTANNGWQWGNCCIPANETITPQPQQKVTCTEGSCKYDSGFWTRQCDWGEESNGQKCYDNFVGYGWQWGNCCMPQLHETPLPSTGPVGTCQGPYSCSGICNEQGYRYSNVPDRQVYKIGWRLYPSEGCPTNTWSDCGCTDQLNEAQTHTVRATFTSTSQSTGENCSLVDVPDFGAACLQQP